MDGGGARNIYEAAFGTRLFMTYFYRTGGWEGGGMAPSGPPGSATSDWLVFNINFPSTGHKKLINILSFKFSEIQYNLVLN